MDRRSVAEGWGSPVVVVTRGLAAVLVNLAPTAEGSQPVGIRPASIVFTLLLLVALAGCGGVSLIGPYDPVADVAAFTLHGKVDGLLDALDADPTPAYAPGPYRELRSDLRVLRVRHEARVKGAVAVAQVDELVMLLGKIEADHRGGRLVRVLLPLTRAAVDGVFRAIERLEQERRRVDP